MRRRGLRGGAPGLVPIGDGSHGERAARAEPAGGDGGAGRDLRRSRRPMVRVRDKEKIGRGTGIPSSPFSQRGSLSDDPLERELAETMVSVVHQITGLDPRVGISDGKFAAYV